MDLHQPPHKTDTVTLQGWIQEVHLQQWIHADLYLVWILEPDLAAVWTEVHPIGVVWITGVWITEGLHHQWIREWTEGRAWIPEVNEYLCLCLLV